MRSDFDFTYPALRSPSVITSNSLVNALAASSKLGPVGVRRRRPSADAPGPAIRGWTGPSSKGTPPLSALAILYATLHIPVACEVLGGSKADLLGGLPMIETAKIGRALPVATVLTPIDGKRSIHQQMAFCRHCENSKMCKTCVSLFGGLVLAQTIGSKGFLAYFFRRNAILSLQRLPVPPRPHRRRVRPPQASRQAIRR